MAEGTFKARAITALSDRLQSELDVLRAQSGEEAERLLTLQAELARRREDIEKALRASRAERGAWEHRIGGMQVATVALEEWVAENEGKVSSADGGADGGADGEAGEGEDGKKKDLVLAHAMVCGDFLVRLACASNQTALELVEDHGVVETFHTLLRRHDAESRTCGAIGLKKFAKFSERAAREIVWRGALDDIRAMLPTCDRYRTPPSTPLAMEKDNILAEAFGVGASDEARAKKVDLEALLSSRKSPKKSSGDEDIAAYEGPAVPNMGAPPPPPPPFVPKATNPECVAQVMELLGALLCHSFVADQFIGRVGGDRVKRGLLPSGKHRPTWTTTDAELNRAFRKVSLRVHPDKNSCVDARKAFDAIGETQKLFKDPARRAEALRTAAEAAFKEKCKRDPELMRKRIKAQEKVDAASYAEDMKRQRDEQRKRAAEAREKSAEAPRRRRVRVRDDDEEDALATMARNLEAEEEAATKEKERANGDESDDDGFAGVVKKRKAKRFMF